MGVVDVSDALVRLWPKLERRTGQGSTAFHGAEHQELQGLLQNVDTPVPGRGVQRGLQGFSHERSSTVFGGADHRFPAATAEQNVDIPVPGGSLRGLSVSGSSSSSAVSRDVRGDGVLRTFPQVKKSATPPPRSGSALRPHSSPWTPAPYHVPMVLEAEEEESEEELHDYVEYFVYHGRLWGPLGSGLASRSVGGWLRQTDPRLAPQSGGRRGFYAKENPEVVGLTLWRVANYAERRSAHSLAMLRLPVRCPWKSVHYFYEPTRC